MHVHGGGLKRVGRPHMVVKRDLTTGIRKIGGPGVKGQRLAGPMVCRMWYVICGGQHCACLRCLPLPQ